MHSSDTLIVMFLKYVFCYFSGIEFPCDVKVIISVVNPEHLKLPVFAGIVMEQFRLGAGAGAGLVDEQKKAQDIHSSRRAKSAVAAAIWEANGSSKSEEENADQKNLNFSSFISEENIEAVKQYVPESVLAFMRK